MLAPDPHSAAALIEATLAVAAERRPLMERLLAPGEAFTEWAHYPPGDAIDLRSGCRYFYHAHAKGERGADEHGHFHLFFERDHRFTAKQALALPPPSAATTVELVHIAAVAIDYQGLPSGLFTINRWVTNEWMMPAKVIIERLAGFHLEGARGDPLLNRWLTALVRFYGLTIARLLEERDALTQGWAPERFEDRWQEVLSGTPIHINDAVAVAG